MKEKTLFDVCDNLVDKDGKALKEPYRGEKLNFFIVGSEARPANNEDMKYVIKELSCAKIENLPAFFKCNVSTISVLCCMLPKTIFQLGSDERPATDENINDLHKAIKTAIKDPNHLSVVVPYPFHVMQQL